MIFHLAPAPANELPLLLGLAEMDPEFRTGRQVRVPLLN